ncbi:MAG: phospholipid-binding protein [Nevskia sp.]|nr:phospholipid-binding protein [Nevskia sp.]
MKVEFKKLQLVLIATALTALAACHKDEAAPPPPAAPAPEAAAPAPSTDTSPASSSSVGGAVDDAAITTKVKAALIAESSLKAGDIKVETNQGVVALTGTVGTADQGAKAEQIAKATAGVTSVNNQLTVKK